MKKLSNNSSWDFEPVFDTIDHNRLCLCQESICRSLDKFINSPEGVDYVLKVAKSKNKRFFRKAKFLLPLISLGEKFV